MAEENKNDLWAKLLDGFDGDIGSFLDDPVKNSLSKTDNAGQKLEGIKLSGSGVITIECYMNDAEGILHSLIYEKRFYWESRAHRPNYPKIRRAGGGDVSNISDIGDFVKDYSDQLEHRGFRPIPPEQFEIGPDTDKGILYKQVYEIGINNQDKAKVDTELSGILNFLQDKYNPE